MKKILFSLVMATAIHAQADTSATVTIASNYIWRGLTFSSNNGAPEASKGLPVVQGSFDYSHSSGFGMGMFVGGSDTYNFDKAQVERDNEYDPTLSYTFGLSEDFKVYMAVTGYLYVLNSSNNSTDWQLAFSWGNLKLEGSYMDNYFGTKSSDTYYRISLRQPLNEKVSVVLQSGSSHFSDETKVGFKNYVDYKAGLSYAIGSMMVEGFYSATDRKDLTDTDINDKAATLALSHTF